MAFYRDASRPVPSAWKRFGTLGAAVALLTTVLTVTTSEVANAASTGPKFTSKASATFTAGVQGQFLIKVTDADQSVMFRWVGKLPAGLTLVDAGVGSTAVLSGTPEPSDNGAYPIEVAAIDSNKHVATQKLIVDVAPVSKTLPLISSIKPDAGLGAQVVSIVGGPFSSATTEVLVGGVSAPFNWISSKVIDVGVPGGVPDGWTNVTVVGPTGSTPLSANDAFDVESAPQPPSIQDAEAVPLGAAVRWSQNAPTDQVTAYQVTAEVDPSYAGDVAPSCSGGTVSVPSTDSYAVLQSAAGVCAQVPYLVTVAAQNKFGTGSASATSNDVVPETAQAPATPLLDTVVRENGALQVDWTQTALAEGGGSSPTFTLTATPTTGTPTSVEVSGSATSATVKGLSNTEIYTLSLTETSSLGTSLPAKVSAQPSASVTPGAPSALSAMPAGGGQINVAWEAPENQGSSAVEGYKLSYWSVPTPTTPMKAGKHAYVELASPTTSYTIKGLSGSAFYWVTVSAVSAVGVGTPIAVRSPVCPQGALASGVKVLSAAQMNDLVSSLPDDAGDGQLLTWPAGSKLPALAPGSVVIGGPSAADPSGVFSIVQSVFQSGSGETEVDTTRASIPQALQRFGYSYEGPASGLSESTLHGRAPHGTIASYSNSWSVNHTWGPLTVSGNLSVNASLDANLSVNCTSHFTFFGISICDGWGIQAGVGGSANASLQLSLQLSGSDDLTLLPQTTLLVVVIPTPIIPIVLTFTIEIDLNLTGTVEVDANGSVTASGGINYASGQGFTSYHTFTASTGGGPLITASGSAEADLNVKLDACLYSVFCGGVTITGFVTATINTSSTPFFKACIGLKLGLNLEINLYIWSDSWNPNLLTLNGPCFTLGPVPTLSISPTNPTVNIGPSVQQFTASRNDSNSPTNNWSIVGGLAGDSIASNGELSTVGPGSRTLTVRDSDSTTPPPVNNPASTTVTVGTVCSYAPPRTTAIQLANFSNFTHVVTYSEKVTWTAPVTAGCPTATTFHVELFNPLGVPVVDLASTSLTQMTVAQLFSQLGFWTLEITPDVAGQVQTSTVYIWAY